MKKLFLIAAAMAAAPAPALAQSSDAAVGEDARIAFPAASIRTFRTVGEDVVYFQDRRRRWYRADLVGQCIRLPTAMRIGVDGRGGHVLDRHSTLLVDGEPCRVHALVRVAGPPPRPRG